MDTTQALCLTLVMSLYLFAVGGHIAERFAYPQARQTPRKRSRQSGRARDALQLFKSLPTELRHQVYRYLFQDLRQTFRPNSYDSQWTFSEDFRRNLDDCQHNFRFPVTSLLDPTSNKGTNRAPPIMQVDKELAADAMPILLDCCWVELRVWPGGHLRSGGDETLDHFNPAQLLPQWTHQIRYLTIDARALRFLRKYNAPAQLTGLQLVTCHYHMVLHSDVAALSSHHDKSDLKPFLGMDGPHWRVFGASDPESWDYIGAHEVNNITNSLQFKFSLHEFMVEMNELFPRCGQLIFLNIYLWDAKHKVRGLVSLQCLLDGIGLLTVMVGLHRKL